MQNPRTKFLLELLQCGEEDLSVLDNVQYPFAEIIEQLEDQPLQTVGLDGLIRAVVDVGIIHLKDAVEDRITELHEMQDLGLASNKEAREMKHLEALNPDEDIQVDPNAEATTVWFTAHGSIYRRYLQEVIDSFENNTGFSIRE